MSRIDNEIEKLVRLAHKQELPGYPEQKANGTAFTEYTPAGMQVYSSDELSVLEHELTDLWKNEPEMLKCVPIMLAVAAKSKAEDTHLVVSGQLYNYTM